MAILTDEQLKIVNDLIVRWGLGLVDEHVLVEFQFDTFCIFLSASRTYIAIYKEARPEFYRQAAFHMNREGHAYEWNSGDMKWRRLK